MPPGAGSEHDDVRDTEGTEEPSPQEGQAARDQTRRPKADQGDSS